MDNTDTLARLFYAVLRGASATGPRVSNAKIAGYTGLPAGLVQETTKLLKTAGHLKAVPGGRDANGVMQGAAALVTEAGQAYLAQLAAHYGAEAAAHE